MPNNQFENPVTVLQVSNAPLEQSASINDPTLSYDEILRQLEQVTAERNQIMDQYEALSRSHDELSIQLRNQVQPSHSGKINQNNGEFYFLIHFFIIIVCVLNLRKKAIFFCF